MSKTLNAEGTPAVAGAAICSAEPPLCKNCKFIVSYASGEHICKRNPGKKSLVDGSMLYPGCDEEREDDVAGPITWLIATLVGRNCGPKARYFQPNAAGERQTPAHNQGESNAK